jgi:DNA-directed RNA polymerase specialized sigma24 family protein
LSAALQLPLLWAAAAPVPQPRLLASAARSLQRYRKDQAAKVVPEEVEEPATSWAFYRRHTENLLRRYLYASMQVGRSPNLLDEPVGRGWASSRPIRTFEDALIFVLDVERCLDKLSRMDRFMIQRIVLQEYTNPEIAAMLRMSSRTVCTKLCDALDRLSKQLVESGVLVLPG